MSVFIIAEAGVNHNGSFETAIKMVDAAREAGVDCIKFQTFISENLVSESAQMADYQKINTGKTDTQLAMLKKLELSFDEFIQLKKYCDERNILFLSTPFDEGSIDFLNSMPIPFWKIPSGEITNLPYLRKVGKTGKPIILSTGMSTISEIENAVSALRDADCGEITLLHCTTEYPAPLKEVNLSAIHTMKKYFGLPVGYSDHTEGILISVAAAAMGAVVIEKHFTLDKGMEGPDHAASLEPKELADMVRAIRMIESAIGNGEKVPSETEKKNIGIARKSMVAGKKIRSGEKFTEDNLTVKRPGTGLSPMLWDQILGQAAARDYEKDEMIEL